MSPPLNYNLHNGNPLPPSLKLALTSAAKACYIHGSSRSESITRNIFPPLSPSKVKKGSLSSMKSLSSWKRGKEEGKLLKKRSSSSGSSSIVVSDGRCSRSIHGSKAYYLKLCRFVRQFSSRGKKVVVVKEEVKDDTRAGAMVGDLGRKKELEEEEEERGETEEEKSRRENEKAKNIECGVGILLCLLFITIFNNRSILISVPLLTCWWYVAAHLRPLITCWSYSDAHLRPSPPLRLPTLKFSLHFLLLLHRLLEALCNSFMKHKASIRASIPNSTLHSILIPTLPSRPKSSHTPSPP